MNVPDLTINLVSNQAIQQLRSEWENSILKDHPSKAKLVYEFGPIPQYLDLYRGIFIENFPPNELLPSIIRTALESLAAPGFGKTQHLQVQYLLDRRLNQFFKILEENESALSQSIRDFHWETLQAYRQMIREGRFNVTFFQEADLFIDKIDWHPSSPAVSIRWKLKDQLDHEDLTSASPKKEIRKQKIAYKEFWDTLYNPEDKKRCVQILQGFKPPVLDEQGRYNLGDGEKWILVAFIDALRAAKLIPEISSRKMAPLLLKTFGMEISPRTLTTEAKYSSAHREKFRKLLK